jgi:hypothetical protein
MERQWEGQDFFSSRMRVNDFHNGLKVTPEFLGHFLWGEWP